MPAANRARPASQARQPVPLAFAAMLARGRWAAETPGPAASPEAARPARAAASRSRAA